MHNSVMSDKDVRRHIKTYNFFKKLLAPYLKKCFAFECEDVETPESPFIVMSNHNTDWDPLFLAMSFPQMYFVASDHIFKNPIVSFCLNHFFSPIPRRKGATDAGTFINMKRRISSGHNICIFPEGERSFDGTTFNLHKTVGRMVRLLNAPLITYRFDGGYMTSPRWSVSLRRGYLHGECVHIYQTDEIAQMSDDEITEHIYNDIYSDAYAFQSNNHILYSCNNPAEGLETALYYCPECKKAVHFHTKVDTISCECGMQAKIDGYGYFTGIPYLTFTDWFRAQKAALPSLIKSNAVMPEDKVNVMIINRRKKEHKETEGIISIFGKALQIRSKDSSAVSYTIQHLDVCGKNLIVFTDSDGVYRRIRGNKHFCARLYLDLYELGNDKGSQNERT